MKTQNEIIQTTSKWSPLPLLALLRKLLLWVKRTENKDKLWRIFILSSWGAARDVEQLKHKKDVSVYVENFIYAQVIRILPDLIAEQDRKCVRRLGDPCERSSFKKISEVGSETLILFNSRIQSFGPEFLLALPTDEERDACLEALIALNNLAMECPEPKSKRKSARNPIAEAMAKFGAALQKLKEHGLGHLTGPVEREAKILNENISLLETPTSEDKEAA